MGLLNRGLRLTPVGASDSHDVTRYIVGQGRTYVRCDDRRPGGVDRARGGRGAARAGVVSYGLLTAIDWPARPGGSSAPDGSLPNPCIRVQGPGWSRARTSRSTSTASASAEEAVRGGGEAPACNGEGDLAAPAPAHDVHLVAVATGPGVTAPHWPTAKPYQPTSPNFTPYVLGVSGAVFVDVDGSGAFDSALTYARREVAPASIRASWPRGSPATMRPSPRRPPACCARDPAGVRGDDGRADRASAGARRGRTARLPGRLAGRPLTTRQYHRRHELPPRASRSARLRCSSSSPLGVSIARGIARARPGPDIILIQADDLGYGDLSAYGQAQFATPGLDRLAREGIRFTQLLRRQHRLRAVARGADDRPAHRPRLDPRQRRDPAARRGRHASPMAAARRRLPHGGHRQVGPRARPGRPASRTGRGSTTRSASSIIGTRTGSSPTTSSATASGSPTDLDARLRQRSVHARGRGVHRARPIRGPFFLYLNYTVPHAELRVPEESLAPLPGPVSRRRRSSTPRPTRGRRRDDRRPLARLPIAADAARGVRRDDHADGSRHRPARRPPRRARARRAHARHVHQRQRPAPGGRRRSGVLQELRRAARHQARSLRGRHPRADDRALAAARSRPAASATTSGRTGTCCRRSPSWPARRRPPALDGMSMARALRGPAAADARLPLLGVPRARLPAGGAHGDVEGRPAGQGRAARALRPRRATRARSATSPPATPTSSRRSSSTCGRRGPSRRAGR